jgi:hypothetical protein
LFHCTPHPGLGTVAVRTVQVDLATCRTTPLSVPKARNGLTVRVTKDSQSIVFEGKVVLTIHENHKGFPAGSPGPIVTEGVSPDRKWILYAIDPQGSASLMADGLTLMAVRVTGGRSYTVASGLLYTDYRTWCGGRLVITTGGDREATIHKQLQITGPPDWRTRLLTKLRGRAWGAVACTPGGRAVVVQSQPAAELRNFYATRWALWRVGLDGSATQLTHPPALHADESPHFAADGTLFFVRSQKGRGSLYALQRGTFVGPLLSLGFSLGYYGANAWPYTVTR